MTAQVLIVGFALLKVLFDTALNILADKRRADPLPECVSDVYDAEKYAEYLSYVSDSKKARNVYRIVDTVILIAVIFSPYFTAVDNMASGNVYVVLVISFFLFWVIGTIEHVALSYYLTFTVDEKYGFNKLDVKGFAKDTALEEIPSLVLSLVLLLFLVFVGEHLSAWTNGFTVGIVPAVGICLVVTAVIVVISIAGAVLSFYSMTKQYQFTPLPEGDLRDDIECIVQGSKKKIRQVYVYDESSKSTDKNAFLAKIPGHYVFGIADNFINENSHDELLAVISHEAGHLKHRKNAWDFGQYAIFAAVSYAPSPSSLSLPLCCFSPIGRKILSASRRPTTCSSLKPWR